MQAVRLADLPRDPANAARATPDLGELLGEWRNCDEAAVGLYSFRLATSGTTLRVRVMGNEPSGLREWGEVAASGLFFEGVDGGSVVGFVAEVQVDGVCCRLQVNLKLGVAVVGGFYTAEAEPRTAQRLFLREFFYRVPT
ncbi:MAG: hypothetical protein AAF657_04140 [Acidobacteriota bacterium]